MDVYTPEQFEYAKNIIVNYIHNTHKWQNNEYIIYIFKVIPYSSTVKFLVFHTDDRNVTTPGGGKSLIIKFDMDKMAVIQELGTQ